jgi:[ribosomal protein S5]-alanine N-acetyltransferase
MIEHNFIPFPVLSTERLILRQIRFEDENEIFALRSDDKVNQFLDRTKAETVEDARLHIQRLNEGMIRNESIIWAITLKDSDKLIGSICFWKISKEFSKAEIGYELLPDYQGKGIMQEVMPIVIEYGYEKIKFHCIEAELSPGNLKSIKLLEKNGFVLKVNNEKNQGLSDSIVYTLINYKSI